MFFILFSEQQKSPGNVMWCFPCQFFSLLVTHSWSKAIWRSATQFPLLVPRPTEAIAEPVMAAPPKGLNYKISHHERSSHHRDFNLATASARSGTHQQLRAGGSQENPLFIMPCWKKLILRHSPRAASAWLWLTLLQHQVVSEGDTTVAFQAK